MSLPRPPLPAAIHHADDVQALARAARVLHTPCGPDGSLVWHAWGDADAPPVVLLHGGAGSWTHWVRTIAPLVQAGHGVWVPDMPGFGDSALPPGCSDADHLPPWLQQGLQQLLADRAVALVGFSFGGLVAGCLAAAQPARVQRLVLVGAPALSRQVLPPLPLREWQHLPAGPEQDAVHRHNLGVLMLAHTRSLDDLAVQLHAHNVRRDRMRRRRLMLTDTLLRLLPGLACPVHGIWGEHDVLYHNRLEVVRDALPQAPGFVDLQLLPDAGHWVQHEAADAFNRVLRGQLHGR